MQIKAFVLFVTSLGFATASDSDQIKRKFTATLNPECPPNLCDPKSDLVSLAYIRADSATDSIHYLWSFFGRPTILTAVTALADELKIDWESLFSDNDYNSIIFDKTPKYSMVTVLNRILLYNDPDDKGDINPSEMIAFELQNLTFHRKQFNIYSDLVELIVRANKYNHSVVGNLEFNLKTFAGLGHGPEFPHLLHNSNATQLDVVIQNLTRPRRFHQPRVALEFLLVTSERHGGPGTFEVSRSKRLDDEYTPGIFEVIEMLSPEAIKWAAGGYLQYRPVSYTNADRDISFSTETTTAPLTTFDDALAFEGTLAFSYFGSGVEYQLMAGMNVTLGSAGDGFYSKTNYSTFTMAVGYGVPPEDVISFVASLVALIGVGVPVLIIVIGCVYICMQRRQRRNASLL